MVRFLQELRSSLLTRMAYASGGEPVETDSKYDVPWVVVELFESGVEGEYVSGCAGVLIGARTVLTALHCADELDEFRQVAVGSLTNPSSPDAVFRVACSSRTKVSGRDLVLLTLEEDPKVGFVDVFPKDLSPWSSRSGFHLGWGEQWHANGSLITLKPTGAWALPVNVVLEKDYPYWSILSPGASLCPLDSGGPFLVEEDERLYVAGIASKGACGQGGKFEFVNRTLIDNA